MHQRAEAAAHAALRRAHRRVVGVQALHGEVADVAAHGPPHGGRVVAEGGRDDVDGGLGRGKGGRVRAGEGGWGQVGAGGGGGAQTSSREDWAV